MRSNSFVILSAITVIALFGIARSVQAAPGYPHSNGGSHDYEYISDAKITQIKPGQYRISVQIFITNPSSCTTGEACPTYDSSPEYVNGWIDWNQDKVWSSNEKIFQAALKGYASISYRGVMNYSTVVSAPSNAIAGTTYMRITHGWGTNPTDPAMGSWNYGDVRDLPVTAGTPKIKSITVEAKGGHSKDQLLTKKTLVFTAELEQVQGFEPVKVKWIGPDLTPGEGETYETLYKAGKHGRKTVRAELTYRHIDSGFSGTHHLEKEFLVFFAKDEDDDGDGKPNWFEYWESDGAVPSLKNSVIGFDHTKGSGQYGSYNPGKNNLLLGQAASEVHYPDAWSANGRTFGGAKGIDCLAEVIRHELRHKWVSDNWKIGGAWHGLEDSDFAVNTAGRNYDDDLPNSFETASGSGTSNDSVDTHNLAANKSSVYKYYGDNEYYVVTYADGAKGVAAKDWAWPGSQTPSTQHSKAALFQAVPLTQDDIFKLESGAIDAAHLDQWAGVEELTEFGTLGAIQSAALVDTNNDQTFEAIRYEVGVTLPYNDDYLLRGILVDANGHAAAWGSATLSRIGAGTHTIPLVFTADTLQEAGLLPPFLLDQLLLEIGDSELVLADGTNNLGHTLSAGESQLAPSTVALQLPATTWQKDATGLAVTLPVTTFQATVSQVYASLSDEDGDIISTAAVSYSPGQISPLCRLKFPATDLYSSRIDGMVRIANVSVDYLLDDDLTPRSKTFSVPQEITELNFFDYAAGEVFIENSFLAAAVDVNSDNLYEGINVEFSVDRNGTDEKRYQIIASLCAEDGSQITTAAKIQILKPDNNAVSVFFSGDKIHAAQVDGPYKVRMLSISAVDSGAVEDHVPEVITTDPYAADEFAPYSFVVNATGIQDDLVDSNQNELAEAIRVTIPLTLINAGQINAEAELWSGDTFVTRTRNSRYFVTEGERSISLIFSGRDILQAGLNGPYSVKDLSIEHSGNPDSPKIMEDAHQTTAYQTSAFEPFDGMVPGSSADIGTNSNTGYAEHSVVLTNLTGVVSQGFRIYVDVPAGVSLPYAHGEVNGRAYFDYRGTIAVGDSVTLTLEFSASELFDQPTFEITPVGPPVPPPTITDSPVALNQQVVPLPDKSVALQFHTDSAKHYIIQYSDDLVIWQTLPPTLGGTGESVIWIDNGPPKTNTHPGTVHHRFYRIVEQ